MTSSSSSFEHVEELSLVPFKPKPETMETWEYINHTLGKTGQIHFESEGQQINFQSRTSISGWHGEFTTNRSNLVLLFDWRGRPRWKTVVLFKTGKEEFKGHDYACRRITMRLLARYERDGANWRCIEFEC